MVDYMEEITTTAKQHIFNIDKIECDYLNLPEEERDEDIIAEFESILDTLSKFKDDTVLTLQYNDGLNIFNWSFE